ncbi:glycine dehydrogenase [miscellaneous Crenarchaeota group-15 archaeon DG-45]|uniref:Glycine dehydrogenase n=1 Tax=miscellaneous Crenarchaeota group-15 archaeon DG-45 TaxID=1685127 RepID=A0A0M0BP85_9ARCH|nr:MAG: glycine dehydrogenase [miscellaneous Crenarchaeota group-15 archaeon DG-45]
MYKDGEHVHPYIPNSVPEIRDEMLKEIGAGSVDELLSVIPERLRLNRALDLPEPLPAEHELRGHVERILSRNKACKEYLSFLGGGCWQHYVPAVCDEIGHRAEFVTAYAGGAYSDLGKWQAFFEFQSMMGELLEMDVVGLPTFDWGTAAGFAIRMAARMTGRGEILVPRTISPERLAVMRTFCPPEALSGHIEIEPVGYDMGTGQLDFEDLKQKLSPRTAAVYFENPSYLGFIEPQGEEISEMAHDNGSECIVGVDPISLGVLAPPAGYGADLVCGEIQPLGIHMNYGGGLGGFIASGDEAEYVAEYPLHMVSITETAREGELGFGLCTPERTLYMEREKGKDFTGTTVGLWTVVAAVYLALMGPEGMREVGEVIMERSHYAAGLLSEVEGVEVVFSPRFFKEFVVNFGTDKPVRDINEELLGHKIFGGKDISGEFPELGNSALYCVTEVHSKEDVERLAGALEEVVG